MAYKLSKIIAAASLIVLTATLLAQGAELMELTSPEFQEHQPIPTKFSCQGQDINPTLIIDDLPGNTQSLALIVDDPDAPMGTWVHWVVFDIPPLKKIHEGSIPGKQGINSAGGKNYHGPCPPSGVHRYFFKIYALDTFLNLKEGISKPELERSMQGHILASAQLSGVYQKHK